MENILSDHDSVWSRQSHLVGQVTRLLRQRQRGSIGDPNFQDLRHTLNFDKDRPHIAVVTLNEVVNKHGTGIYLGLLFGDLKDTILVRSLSTYDDQRSLVGDYDFRIFHEFQDRDKAYLKVLNTMGDPFISHAVCVPLTVSDALNGLAFHDCFGAKLCTYIMDDPNINSDRIPDNLMNELLGKSDLILAISQDMREAYQQKFRFNVGFVPPLVDNALIPTADQEYSGDPTYPGVLVGNVWGDVWLERLREILKTSGILVKWHSNDYRRWWSEHEPRDSASVINISIADDFLEDGLVIPTGGPLSNTDLISELRRAPFAIVPTSPLDNEEDTHEFVARLSIPSRVTFIIATSQTPMIVIGSENTAVSRFIKKLGVGITIPYDALQFKGAVEWISSPEINHLFRSNAKAIAHKFSSTGAREWIMKSIDEKKPINDHYEVITQYCPQHKHKTGDFT
ncbi:MAG: hypothetical protein DHS20C17_31120 [Cyclobacteriaceae bacterium]|nr:MAG: hypothetical protein DHS20C17_31120 [Cyclobacteriaceae bacterium]